MNWFRHDAFGSHVDEWLALAMVILLSFAVGIALLRLIYWLVTRDATQTKGRTKARRSIGAYMEDKRGPIEPIANTEPNLDEKHLPHDEPFHARGFITAKCLQNGVDY